LVGFMTSVNWMNIWISSKVIYIVGYIHCKR
jgi:hypothetical protein